MDWSAILNIHNLAVGLGSIIGVQLLAFFAKWFDANGATVIQAEIKKLQAAVEASSAGKIAMQFNAEAAIFKLIQDEIPIVFLKLENDVRAAIVAGDLTKVDWAKVGKDIWAGIRDQAQGGLNDYVAHSAVGDGEKLCAMIAERIFAKFHMNVALAAGNPTPVVSTTNPVVTTSTPAVVVTAPQQ